MGLPEGGHSSMVSPLSLCVYVCSVCMCCMYVVDVCAGCTYVLDVLDVIAKVPLEKVSVFATASPEVL